MVATAARMKTFFNMAHPESLLHSFFSFFIHSIHFLPFVPQAKKPNSIPTDRILSSSAITMVLGYIGHLRIDASYYIINILIDTYH